MSLHESIRSVSRAGLVRVSNALNPLLWSIAVASPVCFAAAYAFQGDLVVRDILVGVGVLPILMTIIAYFIF